MNIGELQRKENIFDIPFEIIFLKSISDTYVHVNVNIVLKIRVQ